MVRATPRLGPRLLLPVVLLLTLPHGPVTGHVVAAPAALSGPLSPTAALQISHHQPAAAQPQNGAQAERQPRPISRNWRSLLMTVGLAVVLSILVLAALLAAWIIYRRKQRAWHRQLYSTDYLQQSMRLRSGRRHDLHI